MVYSILDDVLGLKDKSLEGLKMYFESVGVGVFEDLYNLPDAHNIIMFILLGYSQDSPMLIANQDYKVQKMNICTKLGIPEYKQNDLVNVKDKVIRRVIYNYLEDFAGAEFQNLMFLKIKLADTEEIIVNMLCRETIAGEEGVVDTSKFDAAAHARLLKESRELALAITRIEKELKDRKKPYLFIENFFDKEKSSKRTEVFSVEGNSNII